MAAATTYVVTSFDFGGCNDVKIHVATADLGLAQEVYLSVLSVCNLTNAARDSDAARMLVELAHVPPDTRLLGRDALTLFWGRDARATNNNNN